MMSQDSRRDPRYPLADSSLVSASVRWESDLQAVGELLDLSRSGLRIHLHDLINVGKVVRVSLNSPTTDCQMEVDASVCWAEPNATGGWNIGLAFQDRLSQGAIDELATSGALERRTDSRQPTSFVAHGKTELEADFHEVQIVDLSDGGFCLISDKLRAKQDSRLLIKMGDTSNDTTHLLRARVAWVNDLDGGQTVGCVFLTRADHSHMQTLANTHRPRHLQGLVIQSLTRWSMVAAMVAIIAYVQFLLMRS